MYFLVIALCLGAATADRVKGTFEKVDFEGYKAQFGKVYSGEEDAFRRQVYNSHVEIINRHNAEYDQGKYSYYLGVNDLADWTQEEFAARNNLRIPTEEQRSAPVFVRNGDPKTAPDAIDWREKGAVQEVKNQGQCGSCWAFGAVGGLEGATAINGGSLPNASEQELVSCDTATSQGCNGGWHYTAFDYVRDNGANGLDTQSSYPYTGKDDACNDAKVNDGQDVAVTCTGRVDVEKTEDALKEAVGNAGPVSIAVKADMIFWQLYSGGILDDPLCFGQVNHAVLAVGYGSDGKDFWIIKNSWGTVWGESGYVRLVRGKKMCHVETEAYYPLVV